MYLCVFSSNSLSFSFVSYTASLLFAPFHCNDHPLSASVTAVWWWEGAGLASLSVTVTSLWVNLLWVKANQGYPLVKQLQRNTTEPVFQLLTFAMQHFSSSVKHTSGTWNQDQYSDREEFYTACEMFCIMSPVALKKLYQVWENNSDEIIRVSLANALASNVHGIRMIVWLQIWLCED